MRFLFRLSPYGLALAAVGLLAAGIVESYRTGVEPSRWLQFESEVQSFGMEPAHQFIHVKFPVRNIGPTPLHIVGSETQCYQLGFIRPLDRGYEILPGESLDLTLLIGLAAPGDYSSELTIFTDCPERRAIQLRVIGLVTDPLDPNSHANARNQGSLSPRFVTMRDGSNPRSLP
jgi:hypothetical protein